MADPEVFPVDFWTTKRICSHRRSYKRVVAGSVDFILPMLYCYKCQHAWILDAKDKRVLRVK